MIFLENQTMQYRERFREGKNLPTVFFPAANTQVVYVWDRIDKKNYLSKIPMLGK